jgi:hypothetical protein
MELATLECQQLADSEILVDDTEATSRALFSRAGHERYMDDFRQPVSFVDDPQATDQQGRDFQFFSERSSPWRS